VVRGEVVRVRLDRGARGTEQRGARYGVIVQSDELCGLSTLLVSPTSTSAVTSRFRPVVEVKGAATGVLVDQTRALSLDRIGESVGRLSALEIGNVNEALALVFGL